MLRSRRFLPVCLCAALLAAGCSKNSLGVDVDDDDDDDHVYGTMSATINGRAWSAGDPEGHDTAEAILYVTAGGDSTLQLIGPRFHAGDTLFCCVFIEVRAPRLHAMELDAAQKGWWQVSRCAGADTLFGSWVTTDDHRGTLTIADIDTAAGSMRGTFAFEAYRFDSATTVQVTGGRFDVPVVVEHAPEPAARR